MQDSDVHSAVRQGLHMSRDAKSRVQADAPANKLVLKLHTWPQELLLPQPAVAASCGLCSHLAAWCVLYHTC